VPAIHLLISALCECGLFVFLFLLTVAYRLLFVFFLLPFLCVLPSLLFLHLSLTLQNIGPTPFLQAGGRRRRPNLGLVCFLLMFAVFLVKDACVCYVVVDLVLVL